jgi:integrase
MSVYIKLEAFIDSIRDDRQACWEMPISQAYPGHDVDEKSSLYAGACKINLSSKLGTTQNALGNPRYKPYLKTLQNILVDHGVILPGVNASVLRVRQAALLWWAGLNDEDKKEVEVFGNRIRLVKYIDGWTKRGRSMKGSEILEELHDQFYDELILLGALNPDYISTKDRNAALNKNFISDLVSSGARWHELAAMPLEHTKHLIDISAELEPFVQVKQLFSVLTNTVSSASGKQNYTNAFTHFTNFMVAEDVPEGSKLSDILNPFTLNRFKQDYIMVRINQKKLSSINAATIISSVRKALTRATKIKGLGFSFFHDVVFYVGDRETLSHKPFSKYEREAIHQAISNDISEITRLIKPYKKTGIGEYPLDQNGKVRLGKGTLENARFLFENHLACKPVFCHTAKTTEELAFIRILHKKDGGLHEIYRSWGILPIVDSHILAPFIFRMAQITGMNMESIVPLNIDDLVLEHHATGKPCLRYWKERSTGAKELHLDLFQAKLQWLTQKQSREVAAIFETVKVLTQSIRKKAPAAISDKLFIYQSTGGNTRDKIMDSVGSGKISLTYLPFIEKHSLKDESGEPTKFVISRFRPSFVSDMIELGVSLREIQLMLGHQSIATTVGYLDKLSFNKVARDKVKEALINIHKKVMSPNKTDKNTKYLANSENIIFTTPLGGCANIFNPPQFVRDAPGFVAGQPCAQYNKCLSCDNVMLIADHLPELFAMRRDYFILMQRNRILDTPYGVVIEENLFLLDEILSPEKSDFSKEDLKQGERLAKFVETAVIDNVGV